MSWITPGTWAAISAAADMAGYPGTERGPRSGTFSGQLRPTFRGIHITVAE